MDDFITTYKSWISFRQQCAREEPTAQERVIMANLDNIKKRAWNALPATRRQEIVTQLIGEGVLPEGVRWAMDIFDAKVVEL